MVYMYIEVVYINCDILKDIKTFRMQADLMQCVSFMFEIQIPTAFFNL